MTTILLQSIDLLLYLIIASQGIFYLLGLKQALASVSVSTFLEQRKAVDAVIAERLKYLYLFCLGLTLLLLLLNLPEPFTVWFISLTLAFLCLALDMYLALTRNIPLNNVFNSYPGEKEEVNLPVLQQEWLRYICYRGGLSTTGFIIMLGGWLLESNL